MRAGERESAAEAAGRGGAALALPDLPLDSLDYREPVDSVALPSSPRRGEVDMARFGPPRLAHLLGFAALALLLIAGAGTVAPPAHASGGAGTASQAVLDEARTISDAELWQAVYGTTQPESFTLGGKAIEQWGDYQVFGSPEAYADSAKSGLAEVIAEGEAAVESGTGTSLLGGFFKALPVIGWGVAAFDLGWQWQTGGNHFWQGVKGPSTEVVPAAMAGTYKVGLQWVPTSGGEQRRLMAIGLVGNSSCYNHATYTFVVGNVTSHRGTNCDSNEAWVVWYLIPDLSTRVGVAITQVTCPNTYVLGLTGYYTCYQVTKGKQDMAAAATVGPVQAYAGQTGANGNANTGTRSEPGAAALMTTKTALGTAGTDDSSHQTDEQHATTAWLVHIADPAWAPFEMPDCTAYQVSDCQEMIDDVAGVSAPALTTTTGDPDPSRIPGAVLGQSVNPGSIGAPDTIALTVNPDPLNGFTSGDGGRGDDGSRPTGGGSEECDFDDYADMPRWTTLISEPGGDIYTEACSDAWSAAREAGVVDAFNNPALDWALSDNPIYAIPGKYLGDEELIDALTSDGSQITDWVKIKSPQFETPNGPAEMHVMQNINTGRLYTGRGWKLVFKDPF